MDVSSVGQRWVVRHRLPDGSATDVIGWIELITSELVVISVSPGEVRRIDPRTVLAARRAPAAPGGRDPLRTSAADLERIALPGWLGEHASLGEWTLRSAGGFTGRANSCLAVGDPGMAYADAAARIVAHAAEHGIPAWAQVVLGSTEEHGLRAVGWTPTYVDVEVLVARLGDLLGDAAADPAVVVAEELDDHWLAAYDQSRPNDADPRLLRMILDGHPPRAFGSVADAGIFAIARGHLVRDWLGLASIWAREERRRQGWGRKLMSALGHWAARRGARNVYLQVAVPNVEARRSYEAMGFHSHHRYGYLSAPR